MTSSLVQYIQSALEILAAFSLALAAVLQAAVLRDRKIVESSAVSAGRRLFVVGLSVLAVRMCWRIATGDGLPIPVVSLVGLCTIGCGATMVAADRIQQRWSARPRPPAG